MAKGKYETEQKSFYWVGIFACISALLLIAAVIALMGTASSKKDDAPSSTPGTSFTESQGSQASSESTQLIPTDTVTEATEETTESTASTETTGQLPPEYNETVGSSITAVVESVIGKSYVYGGIGPDGFDTTGLIYYCFRECDILAPRGLDEQFAFGEEVAKEFLQPGDVVFFYLETPGEAEYVGIYMGNDTFVAVSSSRKIVEERNMGSDYFADRFVGARRYF